MKTNCYHLLLLLALASSAKMYSAYSVPSIRQRSAFKASVSPRVSRSAATAVPRSISSSTAVAAASSSESSSTQQPWTDKRFFNMAVFRAVALVGTALVATQSSTALSRQSVALVHLLAFGTWFGSVVYTTFIAGITMFRNLPKKTFGKLQAKLFPKYFLLGSICLTIQVGTLSGIQALAATRARTALSLALAMTLLNQFALEPLSTANMLERYRLEEAGQQDSDSYKKLRKSFGKFHGMSSLTNLIALCAGVAHAVYLAAALV